MNAAEQVESIALAKVIASVVTLVRRHFPEASPNLTPWRDDPETRRWSEKDTLDIVFHFPGWSPKLECRSLLLQLRISNNTPYASPSLLGVLMRGMTFDGERWRLATLGDWQPSGAYLPQPAQMAQLHEICRDLFALFSSCSISDEFP